MKSQCMNEQIKGNVVKLVMEDGSMRGQVPKYIAINIAKEQDLDLVQVAPAKDGNPPICKLLDYGKIKYKESKNKKHQHKQVTKEIKFGFNISEHDMETKMKQVVKFLSKKYHVRLNMELKGRYRYMKDMAKVKMDHHLESVSELADWEKVIENDRGFLVVLKPS